MNPTLDHVILVDENDTQIGVCEKLEAHQKGLLHRAFSIFIVNSNNELLLQKRADTKYHSSGLWSNSCCSHPAPNETIMEASIRRLYEELNLSVQLTPLFQFNYCVTFENGLTENEIDYVLIGKTDAPPILNPEEASEYRWMSLEHLQKEMIANPSEYTYWFQYIIRNFMEKLHQGIHENL